MGTPGVNFNVDDVFNQILDAYSMNVFTVKAEARRPRANRMPLICRKFTTMSA